MLTLDLLSQIMVMQPRQTKLEISTPGFTKEAWCPKQSSHKN